MDAKIRFDDANLEDVKRVLGTRSDRAAIQAIVRTGLRVVKSEGKVRMNPRPPKGFEDDHAFPAMTAEQMKAWTRKLI